MEVATIQKATVKGQITLPIGWRSKFRTNQFLIRRFNHKLEVFPADIDKLSEHTVFDAIRDNKGKGIQAKKMLEILDEIDG
ncbi:MAG: hypothetical protein ABIJ91_02200 [Candidatus Kuenenbacteria bacterium]